MSNTNTNHNMIVKLPNPIDDGAAAAGESSGHARTARTPRPLTQRSCGGGGGGGNEMTRSR